MNTKELDNQYVAHAYGRFDVALTKGQGSTLYDENGKKIHRLRIRHRGNCLWHQRSGLDQSCGRTAAPGAAHLQSLLHRPCAKLAQLLCKKSGMKKVFFGNSGAEANEGAIKFARKYSF